MNALEWISPHPIYDMPDPSTMAPLERACFGLAAKIHQGETRNKPIDPKPPYITHPAIAVKILDEIGIKDWITRGAAYLHDSMELKEIDGGSDERNNILRSGETGLTKLLEKWCVRELESARYPNQELIFPKNPKGKRAERVASTYTEFVRIIVGEVTNSHAVETKFKDKRFTQAQAVWQLSPRAKIVKMADFAASLLCDLVIQPTPDSVTSRKDFIARTFTIAKGCEEANPLLAKVVEVLWERNKQQVEAIENGQRIDLPPATILSDVVNEARQRVERRMREKHGNLQAHSESMWLKSPLQYDVKTGKVIPQTKGIIGLRVNDGNVEKYLIIVDPSKSTQKAENSAARNLEKAVEQLSAHKHNAVYSDIIEIDENYHFILRNKLRYPMPIEKFLGLDGVRTLLSDDLVKAIRNDYTRPDGTAMWQDRVARTGGIDPTLTGNGWERRLT